MNNNKFIYYLNLNEYYLNLNLNEYLNLNEFYNLDLNEFRILILHEVKKKGFFQSYPLPFLFVLIFSLPPSPPIFSRLLSPLSSFPAAYLSI